jgi:hypothetical protein
LRHDQVGHVVFDGADDENHALLEQARIDVIGALAASGLLYDHGDEVHGHGFAVAH